ncbi:hypothetical protein Pve01_89980 [Planomonospora venezuelensis]|nr:hypothetical protein Pve01_89980 [Planomonospora venezuelensis]
MRNHLDVDLAAHLDGRYVPGVAAVKRCRPSPPRHCVCGCSREGTPPTTANVRRQVRKVLGDAGIEGVTPHILRRTVATVVNEQASLNLASELLGHTDPKVTVEHYIRRNEQVNPLTAELLDQAFAHKDASFGSSMSDPVRTVRTGRPGWKWLSTNRAAGSSATTSGAP